VYIRDVKELNLKYEKLEKEYSKKQTELKQCQITLTKITNLFEQDKNKVILIEDYYNQISSNIEFHNKLKETNTLFENQISFLKRDNDHIHQKFKILENENLKLETIIVENQYQNDYNRSNFGDKKSSFEQDEVEDIYNNIQADFTLLKEDLCKNIEKISKRITINQTKTDSLEEILNQIKFQNHIKDNEFKDIEVNILKKLELEIQNISSVQTISKINQTNLTKENLSLKNQVDKFEKKLELNLSNLDQNEKKDLKIVLTILVVSHQITIKLKKMLKN